MKVFGGETVKSGHIIVRQKGSKVRPGVGVKMGRDYTLYSIKDGVLKFIRRQGRQIVTVQ